MTQHTVIPIVPEQPQRPSENPPKRRFRWLRVLLFVLVLLLALLAGAVYWLAGTESGLRFGLYKIPSWFKVDITSKTLKGTLWKGFSGEGWKIATEGSDIHISKLRFKWKPEELMQPRLHITELVAGDIAVVTKPTPPKEKTPPKLPQSVSLPFDAAVDRLETGRISVGRSLEKQTVYAERVQTAYAFTAGNGHRLDIKSLKTAWSDSAGAVTLGAATPFALNSAVYTKGELEKETVHSTVRLWGSLRDTHTDIRLDSDNVHLSAKSTLHPFAATLDEKVDSIEIKGENINPDAFFANLPKARLDFDASVVPSFSDGIALDGSIDLANEAADAADAGGIPVRTLLTEFVIDDNGLLRIKEAEAKLLNKGSITASGSFDSAKNLLNLVLGVHELGTDDALKQEIVAGRLNGTVALKGQSASPDISWNLDSGFAKSDGLLKIQTDTRLGQRTLMFDKARILPDGGGELNAKGRLELFKNRLLALAVDSKNFNPAKLDPQLPAGSVNGKIDFNAELAKQKYAGKMQFAPSTLSGVALSGSADVVYENKYLSRADSNIRLGSNSVKTDGSFGRRGSRLNIDVSAPDLARFGFGLSGYITAKGHIAGDFKQIEADLNGQARNLRVRDAVQIDNLDFKAQGSPDLTRPMNIELKGQRIAVSGTTIDAVNLFMNGTGRNHRIHGGSSLGLGGKNYKLEIDAQGGLDDKRQWKGVLGKLDISGAFNLHLQNRMNLEAGAERVAMSAARWSAMGGSLNMQSFVWDKKAGITSKGSAQNLNMSELHNFYKPPVPHNMVLNADWDLSYSQNARGYLNISRQSGDIVINEARKQMLGLTALNLRTRFQNGRIDAQLDGNTNFGKLDGNIVISQQFGNDIKQAPINGRINLAVPNLEAFRSFVPVGQTLKGRLNAAALISGRVGDPQLNGTLNGDNLYYRYQQQGIVLDNGVLRSRLQGQTWIIDSLRFHKGGTVDLKGRVSLNNAEPDVDIDIAFNRYRFLDRPNRRVTVSGNGKVLYTQSGGITLTGALKADQGVFGLQKSSMPTLDDDVVILGAPEKPKAATIPFRMNLALDLNNNVRFSGEGLNVTLGGTLNLTANPGETVQGVGTVNVVRGRYKAYGQDLEITKGAISFVGPLSDPNLNIRAERRQSPVGAGVEVLGSLNSPRVTLVADEAMSEKDKLSWLILNRASSGSDSDNAALSAAAGAFLAGRVNDKLGLVDDFGFTSKRSRNAQTGELNPAEQVLTVGKQLTGNLYLGYEYSIESAEQSVKLVQQLSRSLQAVARVGSDSWGGELKNTIRFDSLTSWWKKAKKQEEKP
ncbi:translocation/assembly module TamB domain-containing protein [Neisseria sp.]|uniref:translocation/assembly module TamB domain-containing protein n=1 Tax=Neisseria sp. TaxID=192066 RepID=UPI00359F20A0